MMKTLTENSSLAAQLQRIIDQEPNTIRSSVAEEALRKADYYPLNSWFSDLLSHGCISGMVSFLVYYYDTHQFYDLYYDEIEELREEYEDSTGTAIQIKGDLKNFMAWFGFEETARLLSKEIGLEI